MSSSRDQISCAGLPPVTLTFQRLPDHLESKRRPKPPRDRACALSRCPPPRQQRQRRANGGRLIAQTSTLRSLAVTRDARGTVQRLHRGVGEEGHAASASNRCFAGAAAMAFGALPCSPKVRQVVCQVRGRRRAVEHIAVTPPGCSLDITEAPDHRPRVRRPPALAAPDQ